MGEEASISWAVAICAFYLAVSHREGPPQWIGQSKSIDSKVRNLQRKLVINVIPPACPSTPRGSISSMPAELRSISAFEWAKKHQSAGPSIVNAIAKARRNGSGKASQLTQRSGISRGNWSSMYPNTQHTEGLHFQYARRATEHLRLRMGEEASISWAK
jgi:hypothetical protein